MALPDLLLAAIFYFFIPLWLLAGFCDWLFHRATGIERTSGLPESLLHHLLLAEGGLPLLAGLLLEINALVLAFMIVCWLAHEATVYIDLRYTTGKRFISPAEQMNHSVQEMVPLAVLVLVVFLHWEQFVALATLSDDADFALRLKRDPLPAGHVAAVLGASLVLVVLPFVEETWRCWQAQPRGHRHRLAMRSQGAKPSDS